jgi:hypothetical protein
MKIDLSVSSYWEHVNIKALEEKYNCKFVCESSIKVNNRWRDSPSLIFYSKEKHPQGSNYMAFSYDFKNDQYVVSDGISVTEVDIDGVSTEDGIVIYSRFHYDYRVKDGVMIDGGRSYTRSSSPNGSRVVMRIIDGELTIIDENQEFDDPGDPERPIEENTCAPANGVKGCLIRLGTDPVRYVFRVYDEEYGFIDYEITHHDVDMIINDESAAFRKVNGNYYLDYIPEVLEGC